MRNTGIYSITVLAAVLLLGGCARESADWKSATTADTSEAYQQFLQQHPKSSNAEAAHARLNAMAEDRDWQSAAAADTRVAYEQFVAQHAESKWVQEARIRIENFAQSGTGSNSAAAAATTGTAPPSILPPTASPARSPPPSKVVSKTAVPAKVATAAGPHGNFVQLGAFKSKERAQTEWKTLSAKFPAELKALKPDYVQGPSKSGTVYRLRVPVTSAEAGKGLCGQLKKRSQLCMPVTV